MLVVPSSRGGRSLAAPQSAVDNDRATVNSGAYLAEHRCCLVGDAASVQQPSDKAAEHEDIE